MGNNISDYAVLFLAEALKKNSFLQRLDLSNNHISNSALLSLKILQIENTWIEIIVTEQILLSPLKVIYINPEPVMSALQNSLINSSLSTPSNQVTTPSTNSLRSETKAPPPAQS